MKKVLLVVSILMLASFVASAAPIACTTTADVTTLNSGGGCYVGNFLFNNFQVVSVTNVPTPWVVSIASVSGGGNDVSLNFNPNLPNPGNPTLYPQDIHLLFTVTGLNGSLIEDASLFNGGNLSVIQEKICDSSISTTGVCSGNVLFNMTAGDDQTKSGTFATQGTIYVWKDINVATGGSNSAFTEEFSATGTVPEPATLGLMGAGLLGLGFMRLRRKA